MKNRKIKKLVTSLILFVLIFIVLNIICYFRVSGDYYTSYYGETTIHSFNAGKYIIQNSKYKYSIFFSKIKIFSDKYDYKLTDDEICLFKRKEIYKCYYKTKEKAYKNDPYYHISNTYFKTLADKDGFYIEDNKLMAYFGNEKEVTIPDNVIEIAGTAFSYDFERGVNLEKVIIPGHIKKIDTSSFSYTKASNIVIEEGVEEIKRLAFSNSQIKDISIPKSITNIGFGILDTDSGQKDLKITCYKDSYACNYLQANKPKGNVSIVLK